MSGTEQQVVVYRLYDDAAQLLYVGVSNQWPQRMVGHSKDQPWWDEVARVELTRWCCRTHAELAEREAIIEELPAHNVEHHPDFIQQRFGPGAGI